MLREIVADLRNVQPARVVDVVIEPGLRAAGDASLLRNLLQNLLDNAWKFTAGVAHAQIEFGAGVDRCHGRGHGDVFCPRQRRGFRVRVRS